jgi:hypothetical protein
VSASWQGLLVSEERKMICDVRIDCLRRSLDARASSTCSLSYLLRDRRRFTSCGKRHSRTALSCRIYVRRTP